MGMEATRTHDRPSPEALFRRYCDRADAAALAALFDEVSPHLFRVALAMTPDIASAEDALQATWLAVLEDASRWDASRPVVPWLVGILRNQALAAGRKARKRPDARRLRI